jgi:DNA-binding transcriptional LysR family regulator
MELRQLSYFVGACQNPNLIAAATELGIAQSTLSAGLQALEDQIGLSLFRQVGKRVYPQPAALWLFRHAVALLHMESFARAYLATPVGMRPGRVTVDLELTFAIGRFSKALGLAAEALTASHPGFYCDYSFRPAPEEEGAAEASGAAALMAPEVAGAVAIGAIDPHGPEDGDTMPLVEDPWVTVSLARPAQRDAALPLYRLRLTERLDRLLTRAGDVDGFAHRLVRLDEEPTRLAHLMIEQPEAVFVLPRSMLANRLGLIDVHVETLPTTVTSWIGARIRQPHPAATALIDSLKAMLAAPERNIVFRPRLTLRQLRYFRLLQQSGGISAAARAANVTQPAVTAQLRKLEQMLATPLYRLDGGGLALNAAGARLSAVVDAVDLRLREIAGGRNVAAGSQPDVLRIGMIPLADSGSAVAEAVARTIAKLRLAQPQLTFRIVEARTRALHDWVQNGSVALAIVETANVQAKRIPLGHFEPLAVIANAALGLSGEPVAFARLKELPLVLAGPSFGIRAQLDEAARAAGIRLRPAVEVESFPLCLAMVQHDALCTVLPPRAVRGVPFRQRLTVSTLIEPMVRQSLNVIFSGREALTAIERLFVAELKAQLEAIGAGGAVAATAWEDGGSI